MFPAIRCNPSKSYPGLDSLECPSAADTPTTQVLIPVPSDAQEHTYWYMLIPGDFMVFSIYDLWCLTKTLFCTLWYMQGNMYLSDEELKLTMTRAVSNNSRSLSAAWGLSGYLFISFGQDIDPLNMMPPPNQRPSPNQPFPLPINRQTSSIPKVIDWLKITNEDWWWKLQIGWRMDWWIGVWISWLISWFCIFF